jgi:hypothetical protein
MGNIALGLALPRKYEASLYSSAADSARHIVRGILEYAPDERDDDRGMDDLAAADLKTVSRCAAAN